MQTRFSFFLFLFPDKAETIPCSKRPSKLTTGSPLLPAGADPKTARPLAPAHGLVRLLLFRWQAVAVSERRKVHYETVAAPSHAPHAVAIRKQSFRKRKKPSCTRTTKIDSLEDDDTLRDKEREARWGGVSRAGAMHKATRLAKMHKDTPCASCHRQAQSACSA